MEKIGLNKIREMFLSFFESKEHYRLKSFPLIPQHDKSLLIINSGMAPMKPWFAGTETPPSRRVTTCQKCVRTDDIENVGITDRHGTFFEMMGNFSFGQYFKTEAIAWAYEFCSEWLKLPMERVWATVYEDDDEALELWVKTGIPENRIVKLGKDDNFWEIGTGPCGPCSELYFDRGEEFGCGSPDCKPGCDCDRYIEFWNLVFTQFDAQEDGTYLPLEHPNIDTGMGLERMACVMQETNSIFDVDTIKAVIETVERITGVKYMDGKNPSDTSIRIITDHMRAATFMISDNIMPSNEGRGYVLRRLIRRAARHGRKLGMSEPFLSQIINTIIDTSAGAYPELEEKRIFIRKIVQSEEKKFDETLEQGMELIAGFMNDMKAAGRDTLDGEKAFKLHDTFGFPIDITKEILTENGFKLDEEGFDVRMEQQKNLGKTVAAESDFGWEDNSIDYLFEGKTEFTGYDKVEDEGTIKGIFWNKKILSSLKEGETGRLILDRTPFYAQSGGQESDTGLIYCDDFAARVTEVRKFNDIYAHEVVIERGEAKPDMKVRCLVDEQRRHGSSRNHSATHLLHKALREVLGEHVQQAGSKVDDKELRFDFTHFEAMTPKQIKDVENIVNEKINMFLPVSTEILSIREAVKTGAIGLFEEKYGDEVRVVSMGEFSKELCGGVHVANTGQIGAFKIISESGSASGIRRIVALTGAGLLARLNEYEEIIGSVAEAVKAKPSNLIEKVDSIEKENAELKAQLDSFKTKSLNTVSAKMIEDSKEINGIRLVTRLFKDYGIDDLRTLSDEIKSKHNNVAMVLAAQNGEKITFLVSLTDDVVKSGHHAGKMIKEIAAAAGGGGGGKADMAQAGAKDPSKVKEAFAVAEKLL
ncbi:MAG: alanine--tRNA ligase [Eubacteriaceae bacterium]|jgi:alanyl-tRNA synthetase|nr:alanine--tRNA ligase [Eubacteriaceae bacterium]